MTQQTALPVADLAAIRDRDAKAAPGPWHWSGNVDHRNNAFALSYWMPGLGRCTVLSTVEVERTEADLDRAEIEDCLGAFDAEQWAEFVAAYTTDPYTDGPRTDSRLAFTRDGFLVEAEDLAIFEVAPQATSRTDPAVYRGDITGFRNANADFIAHARADVTALLAEVDRLTAENQALREAADSTPKEMRLCEVGVVVPRPNRPYVFTVDPDCEACVALAAPYATTEGAAR